MYYYPTHFQHSPRLKFGIYPIVERTFLFPVNRNTVYCVVNHHVTVGFTSRRA